MKISADRTELLFPTDEGILQPAAERPALRMERFSPPPSLLPFLDHFWVAEWSVPPGTSFPVDIVAMPCVNLVLAGDTAMFAGVKTERQCHMLGGSGRIAGLRFKPGGFCPFFNQPVARIRNLEISAEKLHASLSYTWAQSVMSSTDFGAAAITVFDAIAKLPIHRPTKTELVEQILKRCWHQPELSIEAIAKSSLMSVRTLEALFHDTVGVSLVWIRRQIRAISAMRMENRESGWADVAHQLGYSDQAHMTNQFRQVVGVPPGTFFRKIRR
ncbi:DUF6597 domain-containing transcriptional factor [Brucella cytisi]|uniref:DUF6597 domain-containing transcriptional factor n=1 Tax=Brucella cytisi TaxID=407152 RepID=UPI0035D565F0